MGLKLEQKLASVDQDMLFLVFIDLMKEDDNLDWFRLLQTLEGYGEGPKLRGLLEEYWSQQVVTRQNILRGPWFQETRGTTQGGLVSSTLLNV